LCRLGITGSPLRDDEVEQGIGIAGPVRQDVAWVHPYQQRLGLWRVVGLTQDQCAGQHPPGGVHRNMSLGASTAQIHHRHRMGPASDRVPGFVHGHRPRSAGVDGKGCGGHGQGAAASEVSHHVLDWAVLVSDGVTAVAGFRDRIVIGEGFGTSCNCMMGCMGEPVQIAMGLNNPHPIVWPHARATTLTSRQMRQYSASLRRERHR
jgi:hypothetical protein